MSKHITGHTGLLCLLGSPVAHSVSPEMHNEACDQLGLDYTYLAFDVPEDKMLVSLYSIASSDDKRVLWTLLERYGGNHGTTKRQ